MKKRSILSVVMLVLSASVSISQEPDEKILMTIDGRGIQAGEFIRMFNKSPYPEYKTDLNEYVGQFIAFKLKVADAIEQGYDTTRAFRQELLGYRNQLAQNYLTDPDLREKLLKEAYERSLYEVNASHILVSCAPDALPADTLNAFKKATDLRERIIKGESFEQVAKASSDDKSVLLNNGNLGYFTVFQMITPFEEAAYTLRTGSVSMPVRTPFGFHIIKVNDKRRSMGKLRVAHIMKAAPPGSDEQTVRKAKEEIDGIFNRLRNGEPFSKLASENSDHKESAIRGGEMNWFGAGEILSDFSEAAFSINDTGMYTPPIRTQYGFHIIKLLEKKAPGSYEESKPDLESKLNLSNLLSLGKKSLADKLKKEYGFKINTSVYEWFVNITDTLIIKGKSKYNQRIIPSENIYSFAGQHLSASDFADYIENRSSKIFTDNPRYFIDSSLESISNDHIIQFENSILEQKYPDFRYMMNEFHDGILLFDISMNKIWDRVRQDSAGLRRYYESKKDLYLSEKSIEAKIYTLKEPDGRKRLEKAIRKYSRRSETDAMLKRKFNTGADTLLTIREGKWEAGDDEDIDKISWTAGYHSSILNAFPSVINIIRINEPYPLPFEDVQSEMIPEYEDWLTEEWLEQLRKKYPVNIDNQVFDEVKRRLENE